MHCPQRNFIYMKMQNVVGDIKVLARKASHAQEGSARQDQYIAEIKVEKGRLEKNRADLATHEANCEECQGMESSNE